MHAEGNKTKDALLKDQKRTGKEKKYDGHLHCSNDKPGTGSLVQANINSSRMKQTKQTKTNE